MDAAATNNVSVMNVNIQNADGLTPLHFAVIHDQKDIVLELLKCKPIIKR